MISPSRKLISPILSISLITFVGCVPSEGRHSPLPIAGVLSGLLMGLLRNWLPILLVAIVIVMAVSALTATGWSVVSGNSQRNSRHGWAKLIYALIGLAVSIFLLFTLRQL